MNFINYVLGPKMYADYDASVAQQLYEPGGLERFGDQVLTTLSLMWSLGCYASPFIVTFLYRRGYFVTDSIASLAKLSTSLGLIVVLSLCMRGFGRAQSRSYGKMLKALELAKNPQTAEAGKRSLRRFDIDFRSWTVDFDVNTSQGDGSKRKPVALDSRDAARTRRLGTLPCEIAAYIAIHTFGIRMIYPGSVKLVQSYMRPMLVAGRTKLIEEERGVRYKIRTVEENEIDSVFVDKRQRNPNGDTLVICCEGNAGFYEIGIMGTPIALNYSVLGWNHPGFEGSSGKPYPPQDKNAIDAVVRFAIDQLGFALEDIILYGWSIGGFSALWAAAAYPDVKGVVLDATFDDVLQLAQPRMPECLAGVVQIAIRDHCDLNNAALLKQYGGPILLIRRTEDEIIAEDNRIETNRGNFLALNLLKHRYPNIFTAAQIKRVTEILSKPLEAHDFRSADDELCMSRLITYASDQGKAFPLLIGADYSEAVREQIADFLLRKHLLDYKSSHCTPLPPRYFGIPWDIPTENGFVWAEH